MALAKLVGKSAAVLAAGTMAASSAGVAPAAAAPDRTPASAVLVAPGRGAADIEEMRRQLAGGHRGAFVRCWYGVSIESAANHRYVSAEMGYGSNSYAMLRARAVEIGPWERFSVCRDYGTRRTIIRSEYNNLMVSAEVGYGGDDHGMLRARASVEGLWEQFYTGTDPNRGGQVTLFAAGNRTYVSAELGYGGGDNGMLRARALAIGPWEVFNW